MPVRDHRNSQLWRAGFHGADMQPCTIHAVRPSLLISRPARLTRFDLRFMTAFDIPRETDPFLPPPPPPSPTRPRRWFVPLSLCVCVCVSSVAVCVCVCVFFLNYRYFYHYPGGHLCSPWNIYIYIGWIIIRGFLRLVGKWLVLYVYFLKNEFCRNGSGFSERGEIRGGIGRVLWLDWRKRGKICFKCCVGLF